MNHLIDKSQFLLIKNIFNMEPYLNTFLKLYIKPNLAFNLAIYSSYSLLLIVQFLISNIYMSNLFFC